MKDKFRELFACIPREESRLCPDTDWQPAADVFETEDGWGIKFDLSGVRPDEVQIHVSGRRLTLSGVRRDHAQQASVRYYRMEISYNSFQRTIELPSEVDPERVVTDFQHGMLLVRLYERKAS